MRQILGKERGNNGLSDNKVTATGSRIDDLMARIEFKETWDAAASLKTICAFANDLDNWGGGYIVIGVNEVNGRPNHPLAGVPIDRVDYYLKDILAKCKLIRPAYMPIVEVADFEGKKFIVLWCPGGDVRPYSSPKTMVKEDKMRICYIRKTSSTIEPSDEELRDLYSLANRIPFDDRLNHEADIADLNLTLIQSYLKDEYAKPKNVGLMFFSLEPERFFPDSQIDIVQFPNGLGGDNITERTFTVPLHQQLREALLYIKNSIITERVIKYPDRAEADRFFNFPYAAIEEALSNAVYHRGYDVREPIEVRVETDRIEIVSFPGPDRSVTIEGLKNFRVTNRRYRNRRIGEFLKELHLTEGRNAGFKKIIDALQHNGSPKPEFETDDDHSYFITRLFIHEKFLLRNVPVNVPVNVLSEELEAILNQCGKTKRLNFEKILKQISQKSNVSRDEMATALGVTRRTIGRYLKELRELDVIERVGSDKSGHWIIK